MANTPNVVVRAEPELLADAARNAPGLPADAPVAQVIRYALATLAGRPDPLAVAARRRGPKPKAPTAA